jgi:plasmid stabilization system protein ParE
MSRYQLIISPAAQNDLRNIYQFGLWRWGKLQSVRYLNNLKTRLWALTQQPHIGIERPDLQPEIKKLPWRQPRCILSNPGTINPVFFLFLFPSLFPSHLIIYCQLMLFTLLNDLIPIADFLPKTL